MLEGLRCLPLDHQIVLELTYWEDMSDRDVADVLDVPHGTVKSRVRRARLALDEHIERLSASPAELASTRANLEAWARGLRDQVGPAER